MTNTATASISARVASPASHHVRANVSAAMTTTIGTNTADTRSARRWMGAFDPCASATSRTIPASSVVLPTPVASQRNIPSWFNVPANSCAPDAFGTARLSPVSMLSSTLERPSRTTPSTGTLSPARMTRWSPMTTAESGSSTRAPSRSTRAIFGCSLSKPSSAAEVPALARASSNLPRSTSVITAAPASK